MQSDSHLPLLVLDASAGSGKTYNLVRRYLKLLLSNTNPTEMKEIVAMTFTNKAATEMKTRIVRDLHRLAWRTAEFPDDVKSMAAECECTEEQLVRNARVALTRLLHAYEDFHVLTIDKFNLRLIRSFSRDLNLPEQFEITLEENLLLEKAVDELLSRITSEENNRLAHLAMQFAMENHESEQSWDLRTSIINHAQILRSEKFFTEVEQLRSLDFSSEEYQLLKLQMQTIVTSHDQLRRNLQLTYEPVRDFFEQPGKKQAGGKIRQFIEFEITDPRYQKNDYLNTHYEALLKVGPECGAFDMKAVNELTTFLQENLGRISVLQMQLKKFYVMAFLRELANAMEEIRTKDGVIRISEFNKLISELVRNEEAPFIYERLGSRFKHFFLDEFQDTSRLQWSNLVPLLHESMSHNRFNLIVGDAKQSIYRFKNGVAQQFVVLPEIYNPEQNPHIALTSRYFSERGTKKPLEDNWRSAAEIVQFNNELFVHLAGKLPEEAQGFYSSIRQNAKGKAGGLITFHMTGADKKSEDFLGEELKRVESWVKECISDGYRPFDICILCLKKKDGNLVASHLRKLGFEVVSSDSLLLGADIAVNSAVAFLEWKYYHGDPQFSKRFADLWLRQQYADPMSEYLSLLQEDDFGRKQLRISELEKRIPGIGKLLSASFQDLYTLLKDVYRVLRLNENENAWLFQLLDTAAEFDKSNGPDLKGFIDYFNLKKNEINVQTPDSENAIRLMTVHKSKGLEFPVVIYPSFSFRDSSEKPVLAAINDSVIHLHLKNMPLVPELNEQNEAEEAARELDKMNELYVALTRPIDRLYFSAPAKTRLNKHLLETLQEQYPDFVTSDGISGTIGQAPEIGHAEVARENRFIPANLSETLWFPEISLMSPEEEENSALNRQKRIGTQVHSILETAENIEAARELLNKGILTGRIESELKNEIGALLSAVFSNSEYRSLLERGESYSERTLVLDAELKLRPDKLILRENSVIVIDYKTGDALPEHRQQVANYLFALREIGFEQTEGYLYYLQQNKLERIQTDLFS